MLNGTKQRFFKASEPISVQIIFEISSSRAVADPSQKQALNAYLHRERSRVWFSPPQFMAKISVPTPRTRCLRGNPSSLSRRAVAFPLHSTSHPLWKAAPRRTIEVHFEAKPASHAWPLPNGSLNRSTRPGRGRHGKRHGYSQSHRIGQSRTPRAAAHHPGHCLCSGAGRRPGHVHVPPGLPPPRWEQVDPPGGLLRFLRADAPLRRLPARPPPHRAQTERAYSGGAGTQPDLAASGQRRLAADHARSESFLGSPHDGIPEGHDHAEDAFSFACEGQARERVRKSRPSYGRNYK